MRRGLKKGRLWLPGPCQIIERLPVTKNGEFQYEIRNTFEEPDRVARESELTLVSKFPGWRRSTPDNAWSLLIRWAQRTRHQAETPFIPLSKFGSALSSPSCAVRATLLKWDTLDWSLRIELSNGDNLNLDIGGSVTCGLGRNIFSLWFEGGSLEDEKKPSARPERLFTGDVRMALSRDLQKPFSLESSTTLPSPESALLFCPGANLCHASTRKPQSGQ